MMDEDTTTTCCISDNSSSPSKSPGRAAALAKRLEELSLRRTQASTKLPSNSNNNSQPVASASAAAVNDESAARVIIMSELVTHPTDSNNNNNKVIDVVSAPPMKAKKKIIIEKSSDASGGLSSSLPVLVNYLRVNCDFDSGDGHYLVYQYHVTFTPHVDANHRSAIMGQPSVMDKLGCCCCFFDDFSTLLLPYQLLNAEAGINNSIRIVAKHPINNTEQRRSDVTVEVTFRKKKTAASSFDMPLLSAIMAKLMVNGIGWLRIGDNFYNPKQCIRLSEHGLEVWQGFAVTCKRAKDNEDNDDDDNNKDKDLMLIEMDVSTHIRRIDTVLDLMQSIARQKLSTANYKDECLRNLLDQVVSTRYNNRTYRIQDIDWKNTPESALVSAKKNNGSSGSGSGSISLATYFQDEFGVQIDDLSQPLLVAKVKADGRRHHHRRRNRQKFGNDKSSRLVTLLVPELCHLADTRDKQQCDVDLKRRIAQITRLSPVQRIDEVKRFLENINSNEQCRAIMAAWRLSLAPSLARVDGHVLPPEKICTRDASIDQTQYENGDFWRCIDSLRPLVAIPLDNWAIIYERRLQQIADDMIMRFVEIGRKLGSLRVSQPQRHVINSGAELKPRTVDFIYTIRKLKEEQAEASPPISMVMVLLGPLEHDHHQQLYVAVKQECNKAGLVSQCVNVARKGVRKLEMISRQLFFQMEAKMGAELWGVPMPDSSKLGGLMSVGLDVYHSPHRGEASWVALVGSLNQTQTRYYNVVCKQLPGEEAAHGIALGFVKLLVAYRQVNCSLPKQVIVFRDGLGSSQLRMSQEFEVKQFHEAFSAIDASYHPEFVFIVCVKRIGVRLFDARKSANPPPGTVVDRLIGNSSNNNNDNWYDFYLVSKSVRQGTVTPTHYVIIEDTSRYSRFQLQRLVWKFTHICYTRACTVRQPAPVIYADRLAYMVGHILKCEPHVHMRDKLFYL